MKTASSNLCFCGPQADKQKRHWLPVQQRGPPPNCGMTWKVGNQSKSRQLLLNFAHKLNSFRVVKTSPLHFVVSSKRTRRDPEPLRKQTFLHSGCSSSMQRKQNASQKLFEGNNYLHNIIGHPFYTHIGVSEVKNIIGPSHSCYYYKLPKCQKRLLFRVL